MSMMRSNNVMSEFSSVTPQTRVFTVQDGVDAMTLCRNHVWIASQTGAIEVRNVHTGQIAHAFQPALPSSRMQLNSTGNSHVSDTRFTTNRTQISKYVNSISGSSSSNYPTYHHLHHHDRYINNEQELFQEDVNRGNRIWVMLGVQNESTKQNQVWIGLSCGTIQVYHGSKYVLLRQMKKHLAGVHCFIDSPDGQYVFSGSSDFLIAQWKVYPVHDMNSNNLVRVFNGHTSYVRCLYAENEVLFSGSDDGTVKVWDVESGYVKCSLTFHNNSNVSSTVVNTNSFHNSVIPNESNKVPCGVSALCRVGMNMWSGDDEGKVIIWQLGHYDKLYTVHAHSNRTTVLRKIGGRVYSASYDGIICIHDASNGQVIQRIREHVGCAVMSLLCGVEIDRYYSWSIDNTSTINNYNTNKISSSNYNSTNHETQKEKTEYDGLIRCWHHDEHVPMTRTREGFNDLRWYHSTHEPYSDVNRSLIVEQDKLEELAALIGVDETNKNNTQNRLYIFSELNVWKKEESIAASIWRLHGELQKLHKQTKEQRNKIRNEEEQVIIREKETNLLQHQLQTLTDVMNRVKVEKNVLSTAPSTTTSAITSIAPAPPPPPLQTTFTITPTSAPVTISVPIPTVIVPSMQPAKQNDTSSTLTSQSTVKPKSWLSSLHLDAPSRTSSEIKPVDETNKLSMKPLTENSASTGISGIALPVPAPQTVATSPQQPASSTWTIGASQVTRGTSYEPNLATLPPPPPPPPPPPVAIVPSAPTASSPTINKTRRLSL